MAGRVARLIWGETKLNETGIEGSDVEGLWLGIGWGGLLSSSCWIARISGSFSLSSSLSISRQVMLAAGRLTGAVLANKGEEVGTCWELEVEDAWQLWDFQQVVLWKNLPHVMRGTGHALPVKFFRQPPHFLLEEVLWEEVLGRDLDWSQVLLGSLRDKIASMMPCIDFEDE